MISKLTLVAILFCILGINSVFVGVAQAQSKSNESGFDWLSGFTVPLIVAIIAAIAASWTFIQARWNGYYFQKLLVKELGEFEPNLCLKTPDRNKGFSQYMKRDFIHKEILDNPSENKDYIFSINVNLLYLTKQLWSAFKDNDIDRFLRHFCYLTKARSSRLHRHYDKNGYMANALQQWVKLVMKDGITPSDVISDGCKVNTENIKVEFLNANKSGNATKRVKNVGLSDN